jgi:hypothetical protein
MEGTWTGTPYVPPRVRDYGDLVSLTADGGALLHVGIGGSPLNVVSPPAALGGGGGGGTLGQSGGGGGAGGGGAGGKGSLPFTGFGAALIGALGAGLSAAGLAARKALRRDDSS